MCAADRLRPSTDRSSVLSGAFKLALVALLCRSAAACHDVGDLSGPSTETADASDDAEASLESGGDVVADAQFERDSSDSDTAVSEAKPADDPEKTLSARSPDCADCAENNCIMSLNACRVITGNATSGPAKGTSKAQLCTDTLACLLTSGCYVKPTTCYCKDAPFAIIYPQMCRPPSDDLVGPCKDVLERGTESTDFDTIMASLTDDTKGAALGLSLIQCLVDNRCTACFTAGDGGMDAQPDSDAPAITPDASSGD
jgi:hypothetical protein